MSVNVLTKTLPSGAKIPAIGLGVYESQPGDETYNAVLSALKLGYRHIDTAEYYNNEADVGRAVKDSGIPRDQIFVTSKLFITNWGYQNALDAANTSNEKLALGYIDLYLLHAPGEPTTRAESWRALEDLQHQGVLTDIGVSNFGVAHLEKLLQTAKTKPRSTRLSYKLHPWLMRPDLVNFCQDNGILFEAYSPLARANKMTNPTLLEIAGEVGASAAQVLVAFSLANEFITLPKSVHEERQKANLEGANIKLTPAQIATLAAMDEYLVTAWDPTKDHAA
ncbi:Aldehyde reductase [Phytophthora megakarya]|uniref:Aldehyde reductase n=1 Tax=Phytophthora megakarya TaxID=4795 RepID=A0A225USS5_9STRA|nr:Aldehyde reductase [Phytophthora megakarya]